MLALLMEQEGFVPSFEAPRHLNGPAIAAKMAGANISYYFLLTNLYKVVKFYMSHYFVRETTFIFLS